MIFHPLSLAVVLVDAVAVLLLSVSVLSLLRASTGSATHSNLPEEAGFLESKWKSATSPARVCFALLILSSLLFLFGLTNVFPGRIPGARCAKGVFQATQGAGERALFIRSIALVLLFVWYVMMRFHRMNPREVPAEPSNRALFVAAPAVLLSATDTVRAIMRIDTSRPVHCCAMLKNQVRSLSEFAKIADLPPSFSFGALAFLSLLLFVFALWVLMRPPSDGKNRRSSLLAVASFLWVFTAVTVLLNVPSNHPGHPLQHVCPWCLFLVQRWGVGFVLLASLAVVFLDGLAMAVVVLIAKRKPMLEAETRRWVRGSAKRILVAPLFFGLVLFLVIRP